MSEDALPLAPGLQAPGLAAFIAAADLAAVRDQLERLRRSVATAQAGGPSEAAAWCAANEMPATLLVDVSAESHPLNALLDLAARLGPARRIVALGNRPDIDLYRQLLSAGIFDYLVKPVRLDLLADTLQRADTDQFLGQGGAARSGRTAAFVGAAGGLGTSTLVAALGQWLARSRRTPTVLVDFDRRKSDLALLLATEVDNGLDSVLGAGEIDPRLLQRTLLPVTPAAGSAADARLQLLAQRAGAEPPVAPERVLDLGSALGQLFSLSLWDLPSHRPPGADEVLAQAEIRVVLTDLSVQGARHTQRLLAGIGDESAGQRLLLVASGARRVEGRPLIDVAQFEDFVGRGLDLNLPHAGRALGASLITGPLQVDPASPYAATVAELGCRLLGEPVPAAPAPGPIERLARLLGLAPRTPVFPRA